MKNVTYKYLIHTRTHTHVQFSEEVY